jgi:hypothetical protein
MHISWVYPAGSFFIAVISQGDVAPIDTGDVAPIDTGDVKGIEHPALNREH